MRTHYWDRFSASLQWFLIFGVGFAISISSPINAAAEAPPTEAWVAQYPGEPAGWPEKVITDSSGNVYAIGSNDRNSGNSDFVTMKYGPSGNQLWVAKYDNGSYDYPMAIAVDSNGNVYVTGRSVDLVAGETSDYATVKYDPNGIQLWVARYGDPGVNDGPVDLAIDSTGNIYVTGDSRTHFINTCEAGS